MRRRGDADVDEEQVNRFSGARDRTCLGKSPLRWTSKSVAKLTGALREGGHGATASLISSEVAPPNDAIGGRERRSRSSLARHRGIFTTALAARHQSRKHECVCLVGDRSLND